jgi:prophage regulatory protein
MTINDNFKNVQPTDKIMRWPEVKARIGLSRSHIHNLVTQGKFPAPIKLGARASGWIEREISSWINDQVAISRSFKEVI